MSQRKHHGRARRSRDGSKSSFVLEGETQPAGAAGLRHERLQHLLLDELAALLRDEISDPRLSPVRISAVALSADGASARAAYVLLEPPGEEAPDPRQVQAALERATGFFHARLAQALELKRLPRLRFVLLGTVPAEAGGEEEGPWNG